MLLLSTQDCKVTWTQPKPGCGFALLECGLHSDLRRNEYTLRLRRARVAAASSTPSSGHPSSARRPAQSCAVLCAGCGTCTETRRRCAPTFGFNYCIANARCIHAAQTHASTSSRNSMVYVVAPSPREAPDPMRRARNDGGAPVGAARACTIYSMVPSAVFVLPAMVPGLYWNMRSLSAVLVDHAPPSW